MASRKKKRTDPANGATAPAVDDAVPPAETAEPTVDAKKPAKKRPAGDRDASGRFQPGNSLAHEAARKPRRRTTLRHAFVAAVDPGDVAEVVRILVEAAKTGKPWAVREVVQRVYPYAQPKTYVPTGIEVDDLTDARSVARAAGKVFDVAVTGRVSVEAAERLSGLIEIARRAVETDDLERRIAEIEDAQRNARSAIASMEAGRDRDDRDSPDVDGSALLDRRARITVIERRGDYE